MKGKIPIKLDKKDRLIMQQLEENSRQSYAEIGRKVELKSDTVEYRINKLLKAGIIIRMFAEPNLSKLGLKTYRVYLKVENTTEAEEKMLLGYFMNHPKGHWFAEFEGEWDYTMRYTLKDEIEFREEIEELMGRFGKYIRSKIIVITLQQSYLPLTHFTGKEGKIRSVSLERSEKNEELDDNDREIMRLLFENSRIKTVDIASKTGISADAVQYRIRKLLERGIISFFGVYYDSSLLGYSRHKVLLWLQHTTRKREEQLIRYCEHHPNSSYLNRVVGSWDLEVDFDAKNAQEIHDILKDLRNKFSDIIRDYSTLTILKEHIPNPFTDRKTVNRNI
jgi:Lrp/AsnC family leucine-responsive transcriptional regulator